MEGRHGNTCDLDWHGFAVPVTAGLEHPGRRAGSLGKGLTDFIGVVGLLALPFAFFVMGVGSASPVRVDMLVSRLADVVTRSVGSRSQRSVLVVTASAYREFDVAAIVEPRGYQACREQTAEQGLTRLRTAPGQFKVVVVDGALPGSSGIVRSIRRSWPDKPVILLNGPRQPAHLAQSLLNLL